MNTMYKKQKILIVDDLDSNRALLKTFLHPMGFDAIEAENGKEALQYLVDEKPDIILLDLKMPEMDGFEVCKVIKSNPETKFIPIVVITSLSDEESHLKALEAGADDFLIKPFNVNFFIARIKSLASMKMLYDLNLEYQERLKRSNFDLMQQLIKTQDITILSLAKLAEFRDPETGAHLERMREYAKLIALKMHSTPKYSAVLTDEIVEFIYKSTPLHDIGKVGIPDSILLKPGKLTPDEFEIMKQHTLIGGNTINSAIEFAGTQKTFLDFGRDIALYHHEHWDGTGYPMGLLGDEIPLCARIIALADVYDALTSRRVYKPAMSHKAACSIILEESDGHFDPDIRSAFETLESSFQKIQNTLKDNNEHESHKTLKICSYMKESVE